MEQEYITQEKKEQLEKEHAELSGPVRQEILSALEYAKSLGDLSENAEYHQAREEQGKLEERIAKIEAILKAAVIIQKHHSDTVELGSTVVIQKKGTKETKKYTIVGSEEADMVQGRISNRSPLGEALVGKKKSDITTFKGPLGIMEYAIIDIE